MKLRHLGNGMLFDWTPILAQRIGEDMELVQEVLPPWETDSDGLQGQEAAEAVTEDLRALPWREIKKRVLAAGGAWTNKAEGIAFLEGR
jgi:hypothetical protein